MFRSIVVMAAILYGHGGCYSFDPPDGLGCSVDRECPKSQSCAADNRCYDADSALNEDSRLESLALSLGSLKPPFDSSITSYEVDLTLGAKEFQVTPVAVVPDGVAIAVAEVTQPSGQTSPALPVHLGVNTIDVIVTAASAASTRYQILVNRGAGMAQQAYVKASNTESIGDQFGRSLALSGDGSTLAVAAPDEASGVNGDQGDNTAPSAGAVYVFVRSGPAWVQKAYIKASNTNANDQFGGGASSAGDIETLALSNDGNTLVVGASGEDSADPIVNGDENDNSASSAGAVYVFARDDSSWSQQPSSRLLILKPMISLAAASLSQLTATRLPLVQLERTAPLPGLAEISPATPCSAPELFTFSSASESPGRTKRT